MPERKLPGNIIFNPWLLLRNYDINIIYIHASVSNTHVRVECFAN